MANDIFADIERLFSEIQVLDQNLTNKYPAIFQPENASVMPVSAAYNQSTPPQELSQNASVHSFAADDGPEEAILPIDEDDLQAYLLRKKYQQLPAEDKWEEESRIPRENALRFSDTTAALDDDELFMFAVSKLADRADADAADALALMLLRENAAASTRFLPVYTALDAGVSKQKMAQLVKTAGASAQRMQGDEQTLLHISEELLAQVLEIIQSAEALMEQGYRNKQEALRKAQEMSRARYNRLQRWL